MNKKILFFLSSLIFVALGTFLAIKWANGYRPDFSKGKLKGTGLLVANSFPTGAQVYIDDKLTTASDDTLNLPPGEYKVKLEKEGFLPWEKTLKLEEELVAQTNARLFPAVPELKPLTFTGVTNPLPSPDGNKIAYTVASASAQAKNGLWLQELGNRPLTLTRGPRQIAKSSTNFKFEEADFLWSPDSSQILAVFPDSKGKPKASILLEISSLNPTEDFLDVTARLPLIFSEWEQELALKEKERLKSLPEEVQQLVTLAAKNLYFSPDEKKILYTVTQEFTLPQEILPSLPASNSQPEERELKPDRTYVYDLEEDKNFFIKAADQDQGKEKILLDQALTNETEKTTLNPLQIYQKLQKDKEISEIIAAFNTQYSPLNIQTIQWFPTSSHLIILEENRIIISEYDGTNQAVVYAGPFKENFVYPGPDGSRLLILTLLNPDIPDNFYMINLR